VTADARISPAGLGSEPRWRPLWPACAIRKEDIFGILISEVEPKSTVYEKLQDGIFYTVLNHEIFLIVW
jgi:hypothetical protein